MKRQALPAQAGQRLMHRVIVITAQVPEMQGLRLPVSLVMRVGLMETVMLLLLLTAFLFLPQAASPSADGFVWIRASTQHLIIMRDWWIKETINFIWTNRTVKPN